jgi:hypothetical protein
MLITVKGCVLLLQAKFSLAKPRPGQFSSGWWTINWHEDGKLGTGNRINRARPSTELLFPASDPSQQVVKMLDHILQFALVDALIQHSVPSLKFFSRRAHSAAVIVAN